MKSITSRCYRVNLFLLPSNLSHNQYWVLKDRISYFHVTLTCYLHMKFLEHYGLGSLKWHEVVLRMVHCFKPSIGVFRLGAYHVLAKIAPTAIADSASSTLRFLAAVICGSLCLLVLVKWLML